MSKTTSFAILGIILGIPISYYFQPPIIQNKLTLFQYLGRLPAVLSEGNGDFVGPILLSCVLCAIVLGIVGYFMDQSSNR